MADNTAFGDENRYHAGLVRNDCTTKPAYSEIDKLINKEWHTEFEENTTGELRFSGFYGDYEIEVISDGEVKKHHVSLTTETTGYDNRLCDFRSKNINVE